MKLHYVLAMAVGASLGFSNTGCSCGRRSGRPHDAGAEGGAA